MNYADINFAVPIALLAASIVGVVLVRLAAARGERAAKIRTRRLIDRFASSGADAPHTEDGMRDADQASGD